MKNYFLRVMIAMLMAIAPMFAVAQTINDWLSLDNLNLTGSDGEGSVDYDAATHTISYTGDWSYAGWDFTGELGESSADLSAFSSITLHLTDADFTDNIIFEIKYAGIDRVETWQWGPSIKYYTFLLDPEHKNTVEFIDIKSQVEGSVRITHISAAANGELELPFEDFNEYWHGNAAYSYNETGGYGVINFQGPTRWENWIPWGNGDEGKDYSDYDYLIVEYAEPAPCETSIEMKYNPDGSYDASWGRSPENTTFVAVTINKEIPAEYEYGGGEIGGGVRDIIFHADIDRAVYIKVKRAYLAKGETPKPQVDLPDLIVTDISWLPVSPVAGNKVKFSATIKNIGTKATPDDTKHGLAFFVSNTIEPVFSTWYAGHTSSIGINEEVVLTMDSEPSIISGDLWTYPATGGPYYIQAQINDTEEIIESDLDNNLSDFVLFHTETGIHNPTIKGSVYLKDGQLLTSGFSTSASIAVYNVLGKQIITRNIGEKTITLQEKGIYLVNIQDNENVFYYKLLYK